MIFAAVILITFLLLLILGTRKLHLLRSHGLVQGLANYGTWAKSSLPPVLLNTVSLNYSHIHRLRIFCDCFCATLTE